MIQKKKLPSKIPTEKVGKFTVAHLSGEITGKLGEELEKSLQSIVNEGCTRLALNMEEVEFMDSSGIGAFMVAYKQLCEKDGSFLVIGAKQLILDLMETMSVSKFIEKYSSMSEFKKAKVVSE